MEEPNRMTEDRDKDRGRAVKRLLLLLFILVSVFSVMRHSVPLMRLHHVDGASDASVSAVVDPVSQQPVNNSTPASSDVDILPKKFLNRNPRYIRSSVLTL